MASSPISQTKARLYRNWMYWYYWFRQSPISDLKKESFSSYGEDKVLLKYLPEKAGSYLDIGAGHPVRGSNTFLLYKRGWRGVTIDPIFGMHVLHKLFRKGDKKILGVAGLESGRMNFYEYSPTEYSTVSDNRNLELMESGAKFFRKYKVNSIAVKELKCETNPSKPFLLSIDIEGMDLPIVTGLIEVGSRPRVICIEDSADKVEIRDLLELNDYRLMYSSGLNSIFVHSNYLESK